MNAKTTRILKEARPLFWPWCAVILAGALPLIRPLHSLTWIRMVGFFLGIPLLAALPLGNEFQHRTFSLLLAQPIDRKKIWREKLGVTVMAVVSAVPVFFLVWWGRESQGLALIGAFTVATLASAGFWTLFTRSTLGGIVLNLFVQVLIVSATDIAYHFLGPSHARRPESLNLSTITLLIYAGLMLWLGRRKFERFQATGSVAGDDLLMAGPHTLPGALAGWLRCRPTGPVFNLFRKEFRLLRPVWLIALLAGGGWACLALFGMHQVQGSSGNFQFLGVSLAVVSTLMIAILAGTLSLGEERTSGTHAWHLTLPVPAHRQWLIKLFMALFAGFVGAGLVPLLIAGRTLGSSRMSMDVHFGIDLLVGAVLLSFAAFWCACAVKGTVRAVLWVLPVMIALYFAGELGKWVGPALTDLFFSRFDPFANLKFANAVNSIFDPGPFYRFSEADWASRNGYRLARLTLLWLPTLLLAAGQSYRLFRAQVRESAVSLVRNLLPLAMVAFLCSFSLLAFFSFVGRAGDQKSIALFESIQAVETIQSGAAKLDATHPLQLTVEDLAKASSLSKSTRRWLGNSHITLALEVPPHHGRGGCGENPQPISSPYDQGYSWCLATIPLADGSHFTVAFEPGNHYLICAGINK